MTKRALFSLLSVALLAGCDDITGSVPRELDCDRVDGISLGEAVDGSLTTSDCVLDTDLSPIDWYRLRISSTETVTLTLQSDSFDPYLILVDQNGDVVDTDDDSDPGSTYGSQIVATLGSGTYYIGVNTINPDEGGFYTLYTD